jgi:hypothetical protein
MAANILYVRVDGDDTKAEIGNPLRPYTLPGALNYVNSLTNGGLSFIEIGIGTYNLECPNVALISNDVVITGTGSKSTIINVYRFNINNSATVTMQSLSIRSCRSDFLFTLNSGILNLFNSEVMVNSGALFSNDDGSLLVNGSVFHLTNSNFAPIVNLTKTAGVITNSNFYFRVNAPVNINLPLIGTLPRQGSVALNNVGIGIELTGGTGLVIPFYNVATVTSSIVQVKGTDSEGFILYGTDALPGVDDENLMPVRPFYLTSVNTTIRNVSRVYSVYNPNNYPVITDNLTWNGVQNPTIYARQSTVRPTANAGAPVGPVNPAPAVAFAAPAVPSKNPTNAQVNRNIPNIQNGAQRRQNVPQDAVDFDFDFDFDGGYDNLDIEAF